MVEHTELDMKVRRAPGPCMGAALSGSCGSGQGAGYTPETERAQSGEQYRAGGGDGGGDSNHDDSLLFLWVRIRSHKANWPTITSYS